MNLKKIGILGSGEVAQSLAGGFLKHGFQVMLGTRDEKKLANFKNEHAAVSVGSFEDAATFGELIVLAVKGTGAEPLVKSVAQALNGKTVLDTTNPIADAPPVNGVLKCFTTLDESLMERLQKVAPAANFVKAFNSVGNTLMVNPVLPGGKPSMFIAGNSEAAKQEAKEILDLFDWETVDMGAVEGARAIEPLCILWCIPGFLRNEWSHAFRLVKA
jgi:predicted dinucleotide-binding enzyme